MSPRLRLLLVISSGQVGGGELTFRHLVEYLDLERFEVCIAGPAWPAVERVASRRGIRSVRLTLPCSVHWASVKRMARLFDEARPDIVHSHLLLSDMYAAAASRIVKPPLLLSTVQGLNYLWWLEPRSLRRLRYWLLARLYRGVYAPFDAVVTCSGALRSAICTGPGLRVNPAKASVIFNSIDVRQLTAAPPSPARATDGVRRIVTVANFAPVKGHAVLLRALARLGGDPPIRCLLVGDGPSRPAIEALARELGVADRVEFLGQREDLAAIVRSADLFVFPSLWEGLGIALLEAMALEVPVVACARGGVLEVVQDGVTGILVAAGDPRALAEGIRRGLTDHDLRRRVVPAARARVEAMFDAPGMVAAYERWYESLARTRERVTA